MLTIVFTSSSFGFDKKPTPGKTHSKKMIAVPEKFSSLVMHDVDIILTNDESTNIRVEGESDAVDAVTMSTINNELTVTGKRKFSRRGKVTVYVPAGTLDKIKVYGTSKISNTQPLTNRNLDVFIDGYCKVDLKTFGTVNVEAAENCDYEKVSKTYVVPALQ